jgi:cytochrome c oxidase subunit 1
MAQAAAPSHGPEDHAHAPHGPQGILKYLWSTDHKVIALQYLFTGMAMALIGGFMAYAFRMQAAFPGRPVPGYGVVTSGQYNALITNHGSIMIVWAAMRIGIATQKIMIEPWLVIRALYWPGVTTP